MMNCLLFQQLSSFNNIIFCADCFLVFLGFLWVSLQFQLKVIMRSHHIYPAKISLLTAITILIASRCIWKGTGIYLCTTKSPISSVSGILPHLDIRGTQPGLLFINNDGRSLTRLLFNKNRSSLRVTSHRHNYVSVK